MLSKKFDFYFASATLYTGPKLIYCNSDDEEKINNDDYRYQEIEIKIKFPQKTSENFETKFETFSEPRVTLPRAKLSRTYGAYIIEHGDDPEKSIIRTKIILKKEFDECEDADNFLMECYSKLNGHTPFIVSGYTCSWKEEGEYGPKIPITFTEINDLKQKWDGYVFGIIITNKGDVIDTLCIIPGE